jgi:hypothetical protein
VEYQLLHLIRSGLPAKNGGELSGVSFSSGRRGFVS